MILNHAAQPTINPAPEQIRGRVEHVRYHNRLNGYVVLIIDSPDLKDTVTCVGHMQAVREGETYLSPGAGKSTNTTVNNFALTRLKFSSPVAPME